METVPEIEVVDHEASRVHFSTDVQMNTEINVVAKTSEVCDVHLGFLMENHTYEINFIVPNPLGNKWTSPGIQYPEIQITKVEAINEGRELNLTLELHCVLEGKMKKTLTILSSTEKDKKLTVNIFARIIGKRKGTAMLKNGIKCIHVQDDTMSDVSDWQGFE